MANSISYKFTATGQSPQAVALSGSFSVGGSFTGSVDLKARIGNEEVTVGTYTAATTASDKTAFDFGVAVPVWFDCTALSSGEINANMTGKG